MAKAQTAPAVSEPQPDPGSEVETQLAQIEGQGGQGQSEVENQLAQIEGKQQQGGDSYTAFAQAAKQELDPQYQAFKAAASKQLEQIAEPLTPAEHPGEPELSWWDPRRLLPGLVAPGTYEAMRFAQSQFATSAYQQAEVTGGKMVQGVLGEAGNVLNPAAKYSDQNNAQLQDGISKAQAEIDNLTKEQAAAVDEFSVENAGMRIGQLNGDISAMQKQLASRTPGGQAEPPSLLEQAGSKMLQGAGGIQHDIDVLMGRKPPEAPQDWLHRMMTQEPGVPENPVFEASPAGGIARATGQVAAFTALSELGTVPELLGFAGAQYQGDVDAALAAHKDLATANRAGQMASLFAPVQMMGFKAVLGPFLSGDAGRTVGEVLKNTLKNAAIGAGVGASQQLWENTTAVLSGIDPDRKWNQGLGDSIAQQAAIMTVLGLATETPSFALRSLSNPRIDAYKPPGAPAPETAPARAEAPPIVAPQAGETEAQEQARLEREGVTGLEPEPPAVTQPPAAPTAPETAPEPYAIQKLRQINPEAADRYAAMSKEDQVRYLADLHSTNPQWNPDSAYYQGPSLARRDLGAQPPAPGEPEPFGKAQIRSELSSLGDRVGPRADFLLADERSLPMRYRTALAAEGLNASNFKAFFDRDTGDLVVNPNNIASQAELNDIVNRNFIPNTFRDLANIVPVDSWHQVADNPAVAALLAKDPNADTTTPGLYDPQSGTVFHNLTKINSSADPIAEGLATAEHEIAGHQGTRSQFGQNYPAMDRFLQRVWNGFQQTGTADQVARAAGAANLDALAKAYDLGTVNPDGKTRSYSVREQLRLAEELLARYSERFDPAQLDKAPTVLQRAIGLVKDGLARFQGLHFTDDQAFRFIRDSWRGTEPPRSPEVNTSLLARRIIKTYEPPELERARANDPATRDLADAIRAIAGGAGRESLEAGATQLGPGELASASDRVGAYAASTGRGIDYGRLEQRSALRVPGERDAEHELHVPSGARDTVLKVTRPDGRWGPYGPSLERVPAQEQGIAPGDARTVAGGAYRLGSGSPESYLDRLALSNELFGAGNHLEGFTQRPGSDAWSIVSSQPRVTDFRSATPLEIANYMAGKGFHPVDERTYFDPERQIAVLDAHGGNVLTDQTNGRVVPVDVVPTRVDSQAAAHMQRIIEDPARLEAMKDHLDLEALQRQLAAKGINLEAPRPPAAQMRMEDHFARDEAELADLRAKNAHEGLSPEERQRMDDIEFGPLMKRDIELELGPDSDPNEPAHRMLQRAYETIMEADPSTYGVRVHALRTVINPRDYQSAREFNAAFDQLLYEKGGKAIWQRITNDIYDQYHGDVPSILNGLVRGVFPDVASAQIYKRLYSDLADQRLDAISNGNTAKQFAVELARNKMDAWANRDRTVTGQKLASWKDVYYSAQGILGKTRSDYYKEVQKELEKHPEFAEAVDKILGISRELTESTQNASGVQNIFGAAQRLHNSRVPAEYAKAIAEELSNRFGGALAKPEDKAALEGVFNRFKQTIAAKIKEQGAALPMPDTKKMSASQRVIDALSNWHWFEDAWNQTINELKNAPDANPLFFAKVRDALDAPFSGSELQRVMKEQDVNVNDLFRQHRSTIGASIDTLAEYLSKHSNLAPDKAELVRRTVEGHIQSQVRERISAEFQRILDTQSERAKKGGTAGRNQSMERLTALINMGAFDNQDVANALAPVYGFSGFSPELSRRLTELSDELETYRRDGRNGFQTEGVRQQMLRTIAEYAKADKQISNYEISIFTGNLMSGGPTHVGAFQSEFSQGMLDLVTQLPWNRPLEVVPSFLQAIKALGRGMGQAITDHTPYLWATGKDPALFMTEENLADESRKIYGANIFETGPTQRALKRIPGVGEAVAPIGKIIDVPYRQLLRSVSLLHNIIYSGFGRSTQMLAALRYAREHGASFDEGLDAANDMMYADQGRREAYRQVAAAEGLTGAAARNRVQEMIDLGIGTAEGPEQVEMRKSVLAQADRTGTRANFMQDPYGLLGLPAHYLGQLGERVPAMRMFFPFVRIPTNLINSTLDATPWGFARYFMAENYFTRFHTLKVEPQVLEELKSNLLGRALIGTTGTLGIAIAAATLKDQDGNPLFQIHGAGPNQGTTSGKQLYYQQLDSGWKPHSLQFGKFYWPFEFTPIWGQLEMLGNFFDAYRYEDMPSPVEAVQYSAFNSLHGILERGSLTGIHDLLELLTGAKLGPQEMQTGLDKQFASWKNFVPLAGANLAKQTYQEFIDNRLYQAKGPESFFRDIPFAASAIGMKPLLNFFGEPVRMYPWARVIGQEASDDPVWSFLDRNGISLTKPSARAEIDGKRIKEDDDKFYNYTGFRGAELHRLITLSLPSLERIQNPDPDVRAKLMDKAIKRLETRADLYAKGQLIQGNTYEVPR